MNRKKIILCFIATLVLMLQFNTTVLAATSKDEASYTSKDVKLLACLIYTEAGNQSYKGKVGVGNVIVNRMNSSKFSHVDTIKEVIYDDKWSVQFGVTVGGSNSPLAKALKNYKTLKTKSQMKSCIKAAKAALSEEKNVVGSRLYFTGYSKTLAAKHPDYIKIGAHIFY